ncbi:MAG: hypothetical protein HQ465_09755, partial [Rhodospirillales bacterium]|nr:hypothetical protein [Rhodospirillales bacterium]
MQQDQGTMEQKTPLSPLKAPETRAARRIYRVSLAALIGMMLLGALLTVREWVVLIPSFQRSMQDLFSRGSLLTLGLVIVLLVFALIFRRSLRNHALQAADFGAALEPKSWALISVFAAFGLGILGAGYLLQSDLRTAFRDEQFSEQHAIARLKAQQIDQWVSERAIDLGFLVTSLKGLPLDRIEQAPELQKIVELLLYQIVVGHPERRKVMLFSSEGQLLVHAGGAPGHDDHTELEGLVRDVARDGKLKVGPVRTDAATPPRPSIPFAQPFDAGTAPALRRFVVVLVVDPAIDLFKKLQNWPSDSATSEVVLARRDGDDVLYISI